MKEYDYAGAGAYFVTIVAWRRECLFGEVVDGEMVLNKIGKIVQWEWLDLPKRLPYVELGAYMVMPNHFHGILFLHENVGATRHGQIRSQLGVNTSPIAAPKGMTGRPYRGDQNLPLWARSFHNSNHSQQNGFGNFQNSKKHPSGSVTITNTSFATTKTSKTKRITSTPIRFCGMKMTRILSM